MQSRFRIVAAVLLVLLALNMFGWAIVALSLLLSIPYAMNINSIQASETIYIRPDGSVDPATAPILRDGDVYTFTDNIYGSNINGTIVIQKSNIIIDGVGYAIYGDD